MVPYATPFEYGTGRGLHRSGESCHRQRRGRGARTPPEPVRHLITPPEDAVKAATQSRQSIEEQIAAVKDPVVAAALRNFIHRVDEFTTKLFTGACGPVELSLSAAGTLNSVSLDRVALQGIDNITLAEAFLEAWDDAVKQLESAQQMIAAQELGLDITPAQAQARAEAAMARAEAILRDVRELGLSPR